MPLGVVHVEAVVRGDAAVAEREVSLGARSAQLTPEARKRYPARHSRKATLEMSAHRRGELLRPRSRGANYSSRIVINVDPGRLAAAPAAHEGADRSRSARVVHRLAATARLPPPRTRPASPSRSTNSSRCPPRQCTSRGPPTQQRRPRLAHTCQRLARLRTARTRLSLSTNGVSNHEAEAGDFPKAISGSAPRFGRTPTLKGRAVRAHYGASVFSARFANAFRAAPIALRFFSAQIQTPQNASLKVRPSLVSSYSTRGGMTG